MLTQLTYLSHPTRTLTMPELADLLDVARGRNAALDVTGLLVVAPDRYFQILEGTPEAVDQIYRSLLADRRHENLLVVNRREVSLRAFPDWSMGLEEVGPCGLDCSLRQALFRLVTALPDLTLRERVSEVLPSRRAA